jgi:hypothetical protein
MQLDSLCQDVKKEKPRMQCTEEETNRSRNKKQTRCTKENTKRKLLNERRGIQQRKNVKECKE